MIRILLLFLFISLIDFYFAQECTKKAIYFGIGSSKLKNNDFDFLDEILSQIDTNAYYLLEIHGRTDDRGSEKKNDQLGMARIQSVSDYIFPKLNFPHFKVAQYNHGERDILSEDHQENRQVEIGFILMNSDGTLTIQGEKNEKLIVPWTYFRYCSICDSKPKLISKNKPNTFNMESEDIRHVQLSTQCQDSISCFSIEYRFPYNYFHENASIFKPKPVYQYSYSGNLLDSNSSINIKEDIRFTIYYDTLTNEYVAQHPCYNPVWYINLCGGLRKGNPCKIDVLQRLPGNNNKKTAIVFPLNPKQTASNLTDFRVAQVFGRRTYNEFKDCSKLDYILLGSAVIGGETKFLKINVSNLRSKSYLDSNGFWTGNSILVNENNYFLLKYTTTLVRVKTPRKIKVDSVFYSLPLFDHTVSFQKTKSNRFKHERLEYPHDFQIIIEDKTYNIPYIALKKKYRKRRGILKVKVKRKNLR